MAWFINFYKSIPPGTPPRDYHRYSVGSYQLDHSLPSEAQHCDPEDIQIGISRFEKEKGVGHWKEAADRYEVSELDYD